DICIVILTVGIVVAAIMQWREMHNAGTQTDRIISAAQKIESDLEAANAQNLDALKRTLAQSQSATNASNSQSQKVLNANLATAHLEQRAWVGVLGITSLKIKAAEPTDFQLMAVNSGRTPALHVKHLLTVKSMLTSQKFTFTHGPAMGANSDTVIQPNMQVPFVAEPDVPTQAQIDAIKSGTATLRIYGRIDYEDVFGAKHYTKFCFILGRDLTSLEWCSEYNEAN
ncbi:MAG: hypothetical protein ACHQJX_09165, partial [Candidatus Acidiferrales bacterium]